MMMQPTKATQYQMVPSATECSRALSLRVAMLVDVVLLDGDVALLLTAVGLL